MRNNVWLKSSLGIGLAFIGLGLMAGMLLIQSSGVTAAPSLHGTPNPSATPQVSADDSALTDPTYYADVAPILEANCLTCHSQGGIGYTTFPMDDPALIAETSEDIAFLTGIRYMPPWLAGGDSPEMLHERSLTDEEIAILAQWAENGAPMGDSTTAPTDVSTPTVPTVREDLVLTMPEPYTPSTENVDDYRCFMLEPAFEEDTYVTGFNILPDATSIVHHVIIYQVPADRLADMQAKEAEDDRPGWECYGGTGLDVGGNANMGELVNQIPDNLTPEMRTSMMGMIRGQGGNGGVGGNGLGSWAPGGTATVYPTGTGRFIRANTYLVMQMHYNLSADPVPDQSQLVLQLAAPSEELVALKGQALLGPVEIPCAAQFSGEACDRAQAVAKSELGFVSDATVKLCGFTLEDFTSQTEGTVTAYCDQPVSQDGWIVMVGAHMHELGLSKGIYLYPDTPEQVTLLEIPAWDFHWQDNYWLANPVPVKAGDLVRISCTWDSSEVEHYIVWGEGTQDEMCIAPMLVLPATEGKTLADFGYAPAENHDHAEDESHEHTEMIEVDPNAIPTVDLTVTPDPVGGWNVQVAATNFTFAPEHASMEHSAGEGHAHLYVNGEKVARLYGNWYHLPALPVGTNEISVTLNANSHAPLVSQGVAIGDSVEIVVNP